MGPVSEHAPDWQAVVDRLGQLSDQELDATVVRSADEFAAAEGHPDPLGSYPLHTRSLPPPLVRRRVTAGELDAMRAQLRAFEERYGLPSDRMTEAAAFRNAEGGLIETDELMAWSSLHDRYCSLTGLPALRLG
jgi:hypothetical protein